MNEPLPPGSGRQAQGLRDGSAPLSILFVGHEASRTGAPILLQRLMHWFREFVPGQYSCLLKHGGELEKQFAEICPTSVLYSGKWQSGTRRRRILRKLGFDRLGDRLYAHQLMQRQLPAPDLIYCNTLATLPALQMVAPRGCPVLCHVHELEFTLSAGIGLDESRQLISCCDHFIACSLAVARNLTFRHQVPEERMDIVHEFLPASLKSCREGPEDRLWLRNKLGLGPDTLVVGASGTMEWRKGTDLFIQLAAAVKSLAPKLNVHFVWIGSSISSEKAKFAHDVELCRLTDRVTYVGSQPDTIPYFSGFDLFVLPSREDPFPLVALEVAACGVPIICFDRGGGIPEFVEKDCGTIVPYLDISAMADDVLRLLHDSQLRGELGSNARTKVWQRHDISLAAPKILEIVRRAIANKRPTRHGPPGVDGEKTFASTRPANRDGKPLCCVPGR